MLNAVNWDTYWLYVLTEMALSLSPGPAVMLVMACGLAHGARRSTFASLSILSANAIYFAVSATALGAVLATSREFFIAVKWIGAAYLVYLGLSAIFGRPSPVTVSRAAGGSAPRDLYLAGLTSKDTRFDTLKANFTLDKGRFSTDNLIFSTSEYTVTGAGWFALDRTTRWNGLLVLSPRLTQEIQRDFRWIRHILDRRGRLAIPFRIDGNIPDVRIRIENRNLSQALRGSQPREKDRDSDEERAPTEEKAGSPAPWIASWAGNRSSDGLTRNLSRDRA